MLDSMPLAQYAAEHWIDHAKSGGMDSSVLQLILHLFKSESAPFKNWIRIHDIDLPWYASKLRLEKNTFCSSLYYSSLAGMYEALDCLLQIENPSAKGEVNADNGEYGNALQAASYKGNEAIVKLLLENGAEVNAEGGYYGNALQAASHYKGNEAIVKMLLENEADVNAKGGVYGNALQTASYYKGNEAIVKILLENGAEVNAVEIGRASCRERVSPRV